jgi:hypothetical protein
MSSQLKAQSSQPSSTPPGNGLNPPTPHIQALNPNKAASGNITENSCVIRWYFAEVLVSLQPIIFDLLIGTFSLLKPDGNVPEFD